MAVVSQPSRSRDLDKLILRPGHLVGPNFEPGQEVKPLSTSLHTRYLEQLFAAL